MDMGVGMRMGMGTCGGYLGINYTSTIIDKKKNDAPIHHGRKDTTIRKPEQTPSLMPPTDDRCYRYRRR